MNEEYQSKLNELNTEIESLKNMHENDQRYISSQKELIISLKRVHDVQRYLLDGSYNDYNSGFYNGVELALSILCEVPPKYVNLCSEMHVSVDGKKIANDIRKHAYTRL